MALIPDDLDDQTASATVVKRGQLGAVFNHKRDKLPKVNCAIIWEVSMDLNPPASVKPLKPKFWLVGQLQMKADHAYMLT